MDVSVDVRVDDLPRHRSLVFWALQVDFVSRFRHFGGAHIGFQWNPRHPDARAVNWGGYDAGGRILQGTRSPLPSAPDDPNTRDYPWEPGTWYRLGVSPGSTRGSWAGSVTDLSSGETVVVRELPAGGDRLARAVVWSEVFADCDAPAVSVTWANPSARTPSGPWAPEAYRVSYQSEADGGCSNTDVSEVADGVRQSTTKERSTEAGTLIAVGGKAGQGDPPAGR